MSKPKELSAKRKRFCEEYIVDSNATQAAIRAGYSPKTAQEQGSRLLCNVMVQEYISQLRAELAEETSWSVHQSTAKLLKAYDLAESSNQPSAMVSAIVAVNRTYGLDKDNKVITEQPRELSPERVEELERAVQAMQYPRKAREGA